MHETNDDVRHGARWRENCQPHKFSIFFASKSYAKIILQVTRCTQVLYKVNPLRSGGHHGQFGAVYIVKSLRKSAKKSESGNNE